MKRKLKLYGQRLLSLVLAVCLVLPLTSVPTLADDVGLGSIPAETVIEVFPEYVRARGGDEIHFTASIEYFRGFNSDVEWSVLENHSSGTYISKDGLLVIDEHETSCTLIVLASSVENQAVFGMALVEMDRLFAEPFNADDFGYILPIASSENAPIGILLGSFDITNNNMLFTRNNIQGTLRQGGAESLANLGMDFRDPRPATLTEANFHSANSFQSLAESRGIDTSFSIDSTVSGRYKLFQMQAGIRYGRTTASRISHSESTENLFTMLEVTHTVGRNQITGDSVQTIRSLHDVIWPQLHGTLQTALRNNNVNPNTLFDQWGTHVVTSYDFGGTAENFVSISRVNSTHEQSFSERLDVGGNVSGGLPFLNAAVNTDSSVATETNRQLNNTNYEITRRGRISGGTDGIGDALDATTNFAGLSTWISSINVGNAEILITDQLELTPIWELLCPDNDAQRRADLERAYISRVADRFGEVRSGLFNSTVRMANPQLQRPTNYQAATIISTPADMALLRSNPSGRFILANDIDLMGTPQASWTPFAFSGQLEGNGNTIRGVHLTNANSGMFSSISGASSFVRNLNVVYSSRFSAANFGITPSNSGTIFNSKATFAPRAVTQTLTAMPANNGSITGQVVLVDLSGPVSTAMNRTVFVGATVETVIFRGVPGRTFTGLSIVVNGNTNVVLENFNFTATSGNRALTFSNWGTPALISLGTSNSISTGGNARVIEANDNLFIGGSSNLTVIHTNATTTSGTPDAIQAWGTLDIALMGATLTATGGRGVNGANASTGVPAARGTVTPTGRDGVQGGTAVRDAGWGTNATLQGTAGVAGAAGSRGGHALSAPRINVLTDVTLILTGGDGGQGGNGQPGGQGQNGSRGGHGASGRSIGNWERGGDGGRGGNGARGGDGGAGGAGGDGGSPLNVTAANFVRSAYPYLRLVTGLGNNGGNGGQAGRGGNGGNGGDGGTGTGIGNRGGDGGGGGNAGASGTPGRGGNAGHHGSLAAVNLVSNNGGGAGGAGTQMNVGTATLPSGGTPGNGGNRGGAHVSSDNGFDGWQGSRSSVASGSAGTARPTGGIEDATQLRRIMPASTEGSYWAHSRLVIERVPGMTPRTQYYRTSIFKPAGFRFIIQQPNGNYDVISAQDIDFRVDFSQLGRTLVTAMHRSGGRTFTRHIPVNVVNPAIINGSPFIIPPTRTTFVLGQQFIHGDLAFENRFSDGGRDRAIDGFSVSLPDGWLNANNEFIRAGNVDATVINPAFPGVSRTFAISVVDDVAESIVVTSGARTHVRGTQFVGTDMMFRVVYRSGDVVNIGPLNPSDSRITFSHGILNNTPYTNVTATYRNNSDVTVTFPVNVIIDPIAAIEIAAPFPNNVFTENDTFNRESLNVNAVRVSGTRSPLSPDQFTIHPDGLLHPSHTQITVIFFNQYSSSHLNTTFDITVLPHGAVTGIEIHEQPNRTQYSEGENFDPAGLVVHRVLSNGDRAVISQAQLSFYPNRVLNVTDNFVTITYAGFSQNIDISVLSLIDLPMITVPTMNGRYGSMVMMPIRIDSNPGIAGLGIEVMYDVSMLSLEGYQIGSVMMDYDSSNITENPILFNFLSPINSNAYENGVLITLQFRVLPEATGFASVTATVDNTFNLDGQPIVFAPSINGGVNISSVIPGDVNGDGVINLADIILLRRYVARHFTHLYGNIWLDNAGNEVYFNRAAADVNGDGQVNLADIILLRRYVARHPGVVLGSQVAMFSDFGVGGTFMGAQDAVRTSISTAIGYAGEYVDVEIHLDENPGIVGLQLDLQFDGNVLTPIDVMLGTIIPLPLQPNFVGNQISLTFESADFNDIHGTGKLATVRFRISPDVEPGAVEISMNGILAMTGSPNFIELGVLASGGFVEVIERTSWMVVTDEPEFVMGGAFMPAPVPENANETTTTE